MIFPILQEEIQDFIRNHESENPATLALKKNPFPSVAMPEIIAQIEGRKKAKTKLPSWYNSKNIIYPAKLSIEQTSSEKTASYKAGLIEGGSLIDLTGGFGVDDFYFADHFQQVFHCEADEKLSSIAAHNFEVMGKKNVYFYQGKSEQLLNKLQRNYDWIYIDPSRRSQSRGKVFLLRDCEPNVAELIDFYFRFSGKILIKTAPLLDLHAGLKELKFVRFIHIVAVENEVKELLWQIEKDFNKTPTIIAINLKTEQTDSFSFQMDSLAVCTFTLPKRFLYEPNAALMKSAGFGEICTRLQVAKLHAHSHLFSSDTAIDFPGRTFEIIESIPYRKHEMSIKLSGKKANISVRNFPETVEQVRIKWKIADGGDLFCFFTTNLHEEKIVLICKKIRK